MVILGAHDITTEEPTQVELEAAQLIVHPAYNARTYDNDIALIKLPSSVQETDAIKIVKLSVGLRSYVGSTGQCTIYLQTARNWKLYDIGLLITLKFKR